jgi:predicted kinase
MADSLARSTSSELVAFNCDAPADVRTARAAERAARGTDASDAGPELATVLGARFADWPEATMVDTTRRQREVTDAVITALTRPSCATGRRAS